MKGFKPRKKMMKKDPLNMTLIVLWEILKHWLMPVDLLTILKSSLICSGVIKSWTWKKEFPFSENSMTIMCSKKKTFLSHLMNTYIKLIMLIALRLVFLVPKSFNFSPKTTLSLMIKFCSIPKKWKMKTWEKTIDSSLKIWQNRLPN